MQTKHLLSWSTSELRVMLVYRLTRFKPSSKIFYWPFQGGTSLWIFDVFSFLCSLCLCMCLFICVLWSPAGKELTSWLSFVVSNCEFVTFPLVSWVRCGTWLYRFLIFAPLLTMALISAWVKNLLCIVVLKQGLIWYKYIPLCWSGADTRALGNQKDTGPYLLIGEGVVVRDK